MRKLYYESPYIRQFEAKVLSCSEGKKGWEVVLDQTAFFPEGGGQPADTGTLGDVRVLDVHEKKGEVIHYTDAPLEEGKTIAGNVDWEQRFLYMQEHSGEHIVSGLIHSKFGYDNVGFHMGNEETTIDFNGLLTWDDLMEIEEKANRIIWSNREIYAGFPSVKELAEMDYRSKKEIDGDIRIVSIPDADTCACCGTHVTRTGEIGLVKFISMIHYKGGVRISLRCGQRAVMDYERKRDEIQKISVLLSAKTEEVASAVERMKNEIGKLQEKLGGCYGKLIEGQVNSLLESQDNIFLMESGFEAAQLRQLVNLSLEQKKGKTVLALSENSAGGFSYILGSKTEDMRALSKELNQLLNGRGGGSTQMAQGTFFAEKDRLCAVLTEKYFIQVG